jgi:hypothetical protein
MPGGPRSAVTSLTVLAKMWPTATARDGKGVDALNRQGGSSLPNLVSRQDQTTETLGTESRPVLNPRFVERLMGLPTGWVLPMPLQTINLEHWETV